MHPIRKRRLIYIVLLLFALSMATGLLLYALKQNINYFYGPAEVASGEAPLHKTFRLGGLVKEHSIDYAEDYSIVKFVVTDRASEVEVYYEGILPDLFLEGESMVALGKLNDEKVFVAREVLAKHDNTYMPAEIAEMLKNS